MVKTLSWLFLSIGILLAGSGVAYYYIKVLPDVQMEKLKMDKESQDLKKRKLTTKIQSIYMNKL